MFITTSPPSYVEILEKKETFEIDDTGINLPFRLVLTTYFLFCFDNFLRSTQSILLVNMPVSFLLHAVLEDHGNTQYEDKINADNSKCSSEN